MEVKREDVLARQRPEINDAVEDFTVAVLGCGGLGSQVAWILARLGVGKLILYDFDVVEASNLNRQNYSVSDIGKKKVQATAEKITDWLPHVCVEARDEFVDAEVLKAIEAEADIVVEAYDGVQSKIEAFDFFQDHRTPYVCTTGVAGPSGAVKRKDFGHIHMVGDFNGEDRRDCYLPKVMTIAAMECQVVFELIIGGLA
ncbi:sulfur carrier protein ThiS adenylyltransferase ThiF [Peptoniphilus sp. EMRHCC_23]|uniref:sulfur carrier protein ThiS adenylyltransferase ThiF n=1 Tax=Peptoniphilus rachelemmaiella TaxID=2811779 RepID=UPI001C000EF6|nr:sulfur carrier protein ThiS adenylyltransferase ThiF [Peptoniphilus rachelemmaiella]